MINVGQRKWARLFRPCHRGLARLRADRRPEAPSGPATNKGVAGRRIVGRIPNGAPGSYAVCWPTEASWRHKVQSRQKGVS
jgi:hypothetical protein